MATSIGSSSQQAATSTAATTAAIADLGVGIASFNLGSGLTEIAALTALLGSSTAEALILGNNGAAGLPWAFLSNFGAFSILRSCLAAATPDSLKDTIGVRTKAGDSSLGLGVDLDKENIARRLRTGRVIGLSSERSQDATLINVRKAVHSFDTITAHIVETCKETKSSTALHTHMFKTDPHLDTRLAVLTRSDVVLLSLSLVKLVEPLVLAYNGAGWFSLVSCLGWATALFCALAIQFLGMSRMSDTELDVISGILPTPLHRGSECRLLLGVPKIVRLTRIWRIVWTVLGLTCLTSVIGTYILLSRLPNKIGFIWTGFQLLWLVFRSFAYYVGHGTETVFQHPPIQRISWENSPRSIKDRVRELLFALSTYQIQTHPRSITSYSGDLNSLAAFRTLQAKHSGSDIKAGTITLTTAFPDPGPGEYTTINVLAVIGDTVLSSAAYISGAVISDTEAYDSCLLVIELSNGSIIFVPAPRVLSDRPTSTDAEKDVLDEKFFPQGGSSNTESAQWWYWIPTAAGTWLQIRGPTTGICGTQQARILTDAQLTAQLVSGELYISLQSVDEVKDIVKTASAASDIMLGLMQ